MLSKHRYSLRTSKINFNFFRSGYVDTEQSLNDDTRFYLNGTLVGNCKIDIIWTVKEYYFNGLCYAIRFPQCLHDLGILELVLFFDQATDVFVHHPNQFLSPNSRSRVKIKSSRRRGEIESFKIAATYEIVNLDSSTGKCVDVQDFDGCIYEKLHDIQKTLYNCTVPWLPNRDTICSNPGNSKLAFKSYQNNRYRDLVSLSCIIDPQDGSVDHSICFPVHFSKNITLNLKYFNTSMILSTFNLILEEIS